MENEIGSILSERLGSLIGVAVLIYIFFWWKGRKKKKAEPSASGTPTATEEQKKEESPISGVWKYMKWRFKIAIITLVILAIAYLIFYR